MIKPTIGRVVWFTPSSLLPPGFLQVDAKQPCAALVAYVWSDRLVNLTVSDHYGHSFSMTSVRLLQDDDVRPEFGYFAEWMPYQVGQAAKQASNPAAAGSPPLVGPSSDGFGHYRRKQIAELRPFVPGEILCDVSISPEDHKAGSPTAGDMIARNPKNHKDQWLVAAAYFADNFGPA